MGSGEAPSKDPGILFPLFQTTHGSIPLVPHILYNCALTDLFEICSHRCLFRRFLYPCVTFPAFGSFFFKITVQDYRCLLALSKIISLSFSLVILIWFLAETWIKSSFVWHFIIGYYEYLFREIYFYFVRINFHKWYIYKIFKNSIYFSKVIQIYTLLLVCENFYFPILLLTHM